jgi:hypothetical protein
LVQAALNRQTAGEQKHANHGNPGKNAALGEGRINHAELIV